MGFASMTLRRKLLTVASAAVVVTGGLGVAVAATATTGHQGTNGYGMTMGYYAGKTASFTYTRGFFCDTSVSSAAATGCEAGQKYNHAPARDFDPLYITVPLGFNQPGAMIDCPSKLVCIDHPSTMDLTRLEPALKALYPQLTDAQLTAALKNFVTPSHDHYLTTLNNGGVEWWDVRVVGVTSKATFDDLRAHKSTGYLLNQIAKKNPNIVGPIPTNLFLYFFANHS